jgi:hypothetical protein
LGVGCLRIWALGVYHGFWALGALGVRRWMPPAKALGGVGGPQEAAARWEH